MSRSYLGPVQAPDDFSLLLQEYKRFRRRVFHYWRDMTYFTLACERAALLAEVKAADPVKKCMGLSVLVKYASEGRSQLISDLFQVEPTTGCAAHNKFILRCRARRCRGDDPGIREYVGSLVTKFGCDVDDPSLVLAFVDQLIEKAPKTALSVSQDAVRMLFKVLDREPSLRRECVETLKKLVNVEKRNWTFPDDIFPAIYARIGDEDVGRFLEVMFSATPSSYPGTLEYEYMKQSPGALLYRLDRFGEERNEIIENVQNAGKIEWFLIALDVHGELGENELFVHALVECLEKELKSEQPKDCHVQSMMELLKQKVADLYQSKVDEWKKLVLENENIKIGLLLSILNETKDKMIIEVLTKRIPTDTLECCNWMRKYHLEYAEEELVPIAKSIVSTLFQDMFMPEKLRAGLVSCIGCLRRSMYIHVINELWTLVRVDASDKVRVSALQCIVPPYPLDFFGSVQQGQMRDLMADCDSVRLATLRLACNLFSSVPSMKNVLDTVLGYANVQTTKRGLAEYSKAVSVMVASYPQLYAKSGLVELVLRGLTVRLQGENQTLLETKYTQTMSISLLRVIKETIQYNISEVMNAFDTVWEIFKQVLKSSTDQDELYEALLVIDLILTHQEAMDHAIKDTAFHKALYRTGSMIAESRTGIYGVIFRLIGKMGGIFPPFRQSKANIVKETYKRTQTQCLQFGRDIDLYVEHVTSALFAVCKSCPNPKLYIEAIETLTDILLWNSSELQKSEAAKKRYQKFLTYFQYSLEKAEYRDSNYAHLLKKVCSAPPTWIPDGFIDTIIEFGSIRPFSALATGFKTSLRNKLDRLIVAVQEARDGNPAKVLVSFLRECDPSVAQQGAIFELLLRRADIYSLDVDFSALDTAWSLRKEYGSTLNVAMLVATLNVCMPHIQRTVVQNLVMKLLKMFPELSVFKTSVAARLKELGIDLDLDMAIENQGDFGPSKEGKVMAPKTSVKSTSEVAAALQKHFDSFDEDPANVKQWFKDLVYLSIQYAPAYPICACYEVSRHSYVTALNLFNFAFSLCYIAVTKDTRPEMVGLSSEISQVMAKVVAKTEPADVVARVTNLIVFMDRAGCPVVDLKPSHVSVLSAIKASQITSASLALRCQWLEYDGQEDKKHAMAASYAKVGMYTQAAALEERRSSLTQWRKYLPEHDGILNESTDISKLGDMSTILKLFDRLGEAGGPFFREGVSAVIPYATEAHCISELSRLNFGSDENITSSTFGSNIAPHLMKIDILSRQNCDARREKQALVHLLAKKMEYNLFKSCYELFYTEQQDIPLSVRIDRIRFAIWGLETDTPVAEVASLLEQLIEEAKDDSRIQRKLQRELTIWKIRQAHVPGDNYLKSLLDVTKPLQDHHFDIKSVYVQALANIRLGMICRFDERMEYDLMAVSLLREFVLTTNKMVEPAILQMFQIVFRKAPITEEASLKWESISECLKDIPYSRLAPLADQLTYYQNRTTQGKPRDFMSQILEGMLLEFPTGVVWPYMFSMKFDGTVSVEPQNPMKPRVGKLLIADVIQNTRNRNELVDKVFKQAEIVYSGFENLVWTPAQLGKYLAWVLHRFQRDKQTTVDKLKRNNATLIERLESCLLDHPKSKIASLLKRLSRLIRSLGSTRPSDPEEIKYLHDEFKKETEVLEMRIIAPSLYRLRDSVLPVFGTDTFDSKPQITIALWDNTVGVMRSKQKPRRLNVTGSDGLPYTFILKGTEDLRIDKRAMQVVSLVNRLVHSHMITYSVTPLSPFVGVIQFLTGTTSMGDLIRLYRSHRHVDPYRERTVLLGEMHKLGIPEEATINAKPYGLQLLQIFETTQQATKNRENDLREMFWLNAPTTEAWLNYQRNFSTSAAVMSIIGYIIGLGDRHPDNILIDNACGTPIHIDYGEALWAAEERPAYRETVPFRLTRMMVAAMGPTGYEGPFRHTAEYVLAAIRRHREDVMSILNIFEAAPVVSGVQEHVVGLGRSVSQTQNAMEMGRVYVRKFNDLMMKGDVRTKVNELITNATSPSNLSKLYIGWQPLW